MASDQHAGHWTFETLAEYGERYTLAVADELVTADSDMLHNNVRLRMLPPDQDTEKQEAAADKRREAAQADLASVKAQLEGAEATVSRLQTDKEKALSELHAKQGACSLSDRQLLHITEWIRQKMPPRIRQAAENGLCQQASVSQKVVLHVLC